MEARDWIPGWNLGSRAWGVVTGVTRDEVKVEVMVDECRLAVRLPRSVADELRGVLAGVAGALKLLAEIGAGEPGRICRWARLDETPGFPGVENLFEAFAKFLAEARSAVARTARKAECKVDKLEAVRIVVETVAQGAVEGNGVVVEWRIRADLEGNGRGVARAGVSVLYEFRGNLRGIAILDLGRAGREGECLARGCEKRSLVRIARGLRGAIAVARRGYWIECIAVCLASCKAVEEALEPVIHLAMATRMDEEEFGGIAGV